MGKAVVLLFVTLLLVWFKESTGQTTESGQSMTTEDPKPCGDFPWDSDDVTVNCDYSYHEVRHRWRTAPRYKFLGRCNVTCPKEAEMLVGPPYTEFHIYDGAYFCNRDNRTWLGTEPVCLGQYTNSTMVTDESNRIRLVGGEFYGCVEMYDNVTNQWGPVRGWEGSNLQRMDWADLVCKRLSFPAGLATSAFVLIKGTGVVDLKYRYVKILSDHYRPNYSSTVPKFIVSNSDSLSTADGATLHNAIDRMVRGPCPSDDYECLSDSQLCLACAGQQNKNNSQVRNDESSSHARSMVTSLIGACAVMAVVMLIGIFMAQLHAGKTR